jgi:hypothetical protein
VTDLPALRDSNGVRGNRRWLRRVLIASGLIAFALLCAFVWVCAPRWRAVSVLRTGNVRLVFWIEIDPDQSRWSSEGMIGRLRKQFGLATIAEVYVSPDSDVRSLRQIASLFEKTEMAVVLVDVDPARLRELAATGFLKSVGKISVGFDPDKAVSDADLCELDELQTNLPITALLILGQRSPTISELGMQFISRLPHLTSLQLPDARTTSNGIRALGALDALSKLELAPNGALNGSLCALTSCPLRNLALYNAPIDEQSLLCVAKIRSLETIRLVNCEIPNDALARLSELPHLHGLVLARLKDGAKLRHLDLMMGLEMLSLSGSSVSDKDIESLGTLRRLRRLDLSNTMVTQDGAARLRRLLPECEIYLGGL